MVQENQPDPLKGWKQRVIKIPEVTDEQVLVGIGRLAGYNDLSVEFKEITGGMDDDEGFKRFPRTIQASLPGQEKPVLVVAQLSEKPEFFVSFDGRQLRTGRITPANIRRAILEQSAQ